MKIDFEKTNGQYTLRDAILLPDDHNLTEAQIENIKQQRFDNWLSIITSSTDTQEQINE